MYDNKEYSAKMKSLGIVVIVPTYNNASTLKAVIEGILTYTEDIIVINDGSTDDTAKILNEFDCIQVITHEKNSGKGQALKNGLLAAQQLGFKYAITIDSDGQHYPSDIPIFVDEIEKTPDALLVGARDFDSCGIPPKNSFANKFSNFWFLVETGKKMRDTQSGYRLYPLDKIGKMKYTTTKYEFELELIVFAAWKGVDVRNVSISIYYPPAEKRISHFRPFWDFTRISILNTILVLIAFLWIYPMKFFKNLTWKNIRGFIDREIIHSKESNIKIMFAIMLGIFMGIVPIWGYQMIAAAFLAVLMRLNKVIVLVASNISIPPIMPFLLYGSYATGCYATNSEINLSLTDISLESVKTVLTQYLIGSVIFATICALLAGCVSWILMAIFRRKKLTSAS